MKSKVAGIILAAGESIRFGKPKQLIQINGEYLINRIIRIAINSQLDPVIVVLGANYSEIKKQICFPNQLLIIHNDTWKFGQSSSLKKGLNQVNQDNSGAMVLLGDQPMITSKLIDELISLYENSKTDVVMVQTNGIRTPPIIFSINCYDSIRMLEGDKGARDIINKFKVIFYENQEELLITDIDTEQEFKLLTMRIVNITNK
jgi:molybdenum cofactor cytidylyltransferase